VTPVNRSGDRHKSAGFVRQLEQTESGNLLDMPNDEPMQAGNSTGVVAVAGSMRWRRCTTLSHEWSNGMGVVMYDDELPSTA
jgi:hypothetical protein